PCAASVSTAGHTLLAARAFSASSSPSCISRYMRWTGAWASRKSTWNGRIAPGRAPLSRPPSPARSPITKRVPKTIAAAARSTRRVSPCADGGSTSTVLIASPPVILDAVSGAGLPRRGPERVHERQGEDDEDTTHDVHVSAQ